MITTVKRFRLFRTDDPADMERYDELINNPLCAITEKLMEKEVDKIYEEGQLRETRERICWLVHWKERQL